MLRARFFFFVVTPIFDIRVSGDAGCVIFGLRLATALSQLAEVALPPDRVIGGAGC